MQFRPYRNLDSFTTFHLFYHASCKGDFGPSGFKGGGVILLASAARSSEELARLPRFLSDLTIVGSSHRENAVYSGELAVWSERSYSRAADSRSSSSLSPAWLVETADPPRAARDAVKGLNAAYGWGLQVRFLPDTPLVSKSSVACLFRGFCNPDILTARNYG